MGQIIIDVPQCGVKRRYELDDAQSAEELLIVLQAKARRVKVNPEKPTTEDLVDIRAAKRARKGDLIGWKEVKEQLALD